jgi:predicted Zn finger-like uncharacterized protein
MRFRLCSAACRIAKPLLDLRHEAAEGRDMNIACPICDASYEVPESVLAARRPLRCARCGHDWVPGDAAPEPEPAAPPDIVAEAPIIEPQPVIEPTPEPEDEYDEFVAAKEPETITTADAALAAELVDEPPPAKAAAAAQPASSFVPPRPVAPRPTIPAPPAAPVQPRAAWTASVVAVVAVIAALLIFHAPIGRAWPPMERLYSLLGL